MQDIYALVTFRRQAYMVAQKFLYVMPY